MIISTKATLSWHASNKKRYTEKGYIFTKMKDEFEVDVSDLSKGSKAIVKVKCDYCGEIVHKTYSNYLKNKEKNEKDCCNEDECVGTKRQETFMRKYGVTCPLLADEVKSKIKYTNLTKYGAENVFASEAIKEKIAETNLEKYGAENPFQSEFIKTKIRQTNLQKYGTEYIMQSDAMKSKMIQTKIKNGKNNFTSIFPVVNGVAASKPQIELGKYLNGKINEYLNGKIIDIYLEKYNTAIEYDGGGHTLSVKTNQITKEEFYRKEKEVELRLIDSGVRFVRVKNERDKAFSFEEIEKRIFDFINSDSESLLIKIS